MPTKKVVVLTGSGISAESGLKTFRDAGGLWEGYDINEVASIEGWLNDPEKVLDFYNLRRKQASKAEPNEAHLSLTELESHFDVTIVTQNVDDLHERAGSSNIIHLHGELTKACSEADKNLIIEIGNDPIQYGDKAPDGAQLRPAIVWFGEMVPMVETAAEVVSQADILIVVGTSLAVYPAAGLVNYSKSGIPRFIVDPSTPYLHDYEGWEHIQKTASEGVPVLIQKLLKEFSNG
jgi:NAD-dependent deacetylase